MIKHTYIKPGSTIITDCAPYHKHELPSFNQIRENHAKKEKGDYFQTSPVEALYAKLRHSYSIYRFWKPKNEVRYLKEIEFRLNEGNVENDMLDRIKSLIKNGFSVPTIAM